MLCQLIRGCHVHHVPRIVGKIIRICVARHARTLPTAARLAQAFSRGSICRLATAALCPWNATGQRTADCGGPLKHTEHSRQNPLRLRTVTKPDPDVSLLLAHLGLRLPKGSKLVQKVVEKNT